MGIQVLRAGIVSSFLLLVCSPTLFGIDVVVGAGARSPTTEVWINRGIVKLMKDDVAGARANFDAAINAEPKFWVGYHDRAVVYIKEKKWDLALRDLDASMKLNPKFLRTAVLRADVKRHLGRYEDCLTELSQILDIRLTEETAAEVYNERAWLRATCPKAALRNGKLAVADAQMACKASRWQEPNFIDTLAIAYAESGDFESAVQYEEKAIAAIKARPKKVGDINQAVKTLEGRITRFKAHQTPHS
jgi:tetratricopeptide (TPR) repeat protein